MSAITYPRYSDNSQFKIKQIKLQQQKMSENLLECIRNIKQKYNKYGQFKTLVNQQVSTNQQMSQKLRSMTVAFQVIAQQNHQVMRLYEGLIPLIQDKDKQLTLKELQVKKYREQALDLMSKNEQLTNYTRKLANQYTILLNSMKQNDEVAIKRQLSACSKLKMMQNQVNFLRTNILAKNNMNENNENVQKKPSKRSKSSNRKYESNGRRKQSSGISKSRKSIIHNLN